MNITRSGYDNYSFAGIFLVVIVLWSACNSAHKITASQTTARNEKCAEIWLSYPDQPHPMWQELSKNISITQTGFGVPTKYKAYKINNDTLRSYFAFCKMQKNNVGFVIPVINTCEAFSMKRSGAMSQGLQDKYPDIISQQGNGINNKTADLRLDWDGTQMKAQLTYNGSIFLINPVSSSEGPVYIIYNKEDSPEIKQPFETKPGNTQEKIYDR